MSQPTPFTTREAIRKTPKEHATVSEPEEPPPSTKRTGPRTYESLQRYYVERSQSFQNFTLLVFIGLFACIGVTLIGTYLSAPDNASAQSGESTPTLHPTRASLPPTASPTQAIPDPEFPILSWARIRDLPGPFNWPCRQFCSGNPVVEIEQHWRTLKIASNRAQVQTVDRNAVFMLDSGFFSNYDSDDFTVYLREKSGYTAGTPVLACATQIVAPNDSRYKDYAVGDVSADILRCLPAVLSEKYPNPLPGGTLRGAVSNGLWSWACRMSGADCEQNPLSQWIIYIERGL